MRTVAIDVRALGGFPPVLKNIFYFRKRPKLGEPVMLIHPELGVPWAKHASVCRVDATHQVYDVAIHPDEKGRYQDDDQRNRVKHRPAARFVRRGWYPALWIKRVSRSARSRPAIRQGA